MNYDAWAQQGADYEALKDGKAWGKIVRWIANSDMDHPYSAVRAYEAKKWETQIKFRTDNRLLSKGRAEGKLGDIISKVNITNR